MIKKNILSICTAIVILYLSLASAGTLNKIPMIKFEGMDKVVHFIMYSVFTGVILFENRKRIKRNGSLFLIALIPLLFGGLLEILQAYLTTSRSGNIPDFLFNMAGIVFSVLIFLIARKPRAGSVR
jgi:VanZ family protein